MISRYLFGSSDQRLDAEIALKGHGYDAWCAGIGQRYDVLIVDHPDAYVARVNNLVAKTRPTMALYGLTPPASTSPPSRLEGLEPGDARGAVDAGSQGKTLATVPQPFVPVPRPCPDSEPAGSA